MGLVVWIVWPASYFPRLSVTCAQFLCASLSLPLSLPLSDIHLKGTQNVSPIPASDSFLHTSGDNAKVGKMGLQPTVHLTTTTTTLPVHPSRSHQHFHSSYSFHSEYSLHDSYVLRLNGMVYSHFYNLYPFSFLNCSH